MDSFFLSVSEIRSPLSQVDNLIKLMSIQQRLKYGLPVILMGETGCGKTALAPGLKKIPLECYHTVDRQKLASHLEMIHIL